MLHLFNLSLVVISLAGITALGASPAVERDIAYLEPGRAEKLDVYLPAETFARPLPAVLLIHGGGWEVGDKASGRERNIGTTLAEKGYVVFSINYLLNQSEKTAEGKKRLTRLAWPQNIIDCKTALRFIRAERERFGVDPARIGVMGGSAGGHLSMLVAAAPEHAAFNAPGLYAGQSNTVSCIINLYGTADIRQGVSPFSGAEKAVALANEVEASPVTYFDRNLPPMLIIHGTADKVIPVRRSRELAGILEKLGTDYWYVEIAGAPHTFDLQPKQMDLRPVVLTFLEKHLGKPAAGPAVP